MTGLILVTVAAAGFLVWLWRRLRWPLERRRRMRTFIREADETARLADELRRRPDRWQ